MRENANLDGTAVIDRSFFGTVFFLLREEKESMLLKKLKEDPAQYDGQLVELQGWVRTNRNSKKIGFIELNDEIGRAHV